MSDPKKPKKEDTQDTKNVIEVDPSTYYSIIYIMNISKKLDNDLQVLVSEGDNDTPGSITFNIAPDTLQISDSFITAKTLPLEQQLDEMENKFVSVYEERYKTGDLSFLVDMGDDGIFDSPAYLLPYIERALQSYKKDNNLDSIDLRTLLFGDDPKTGQSIIDIIQHLAWDLETKDRTGSGATFKHTDKVEYPLDKINNEAWKLLEKDTGGQLSFKAEKRGSNKPLDIVYSIDFDALNNTNITINKRLTSFDKRVYIAISALFNAGNTVISLTQIYYAMGNTTKPNATRLEKIYDSITKMTGARIYVNNEQEADAYKYPKFVYDGALLPLERGTGIINGKITEAAIHIFREPPLLSFAKQRKQVTTVDAKLLQSPLNKTEENLSIDDYLIERIARAKKGKQPTRILYNTICEKAHITGDRQKLRSHDKVKKYLDHYKACGMIADYETDKDGVTVLFKSAVEKKTKKREG